jgi:hypothetical protein
MQILSEAILWKINHGKLPQSRSFLTGSWNNLNTDFGSWTLDAGFCIIGLHRLDSISAAGDGLVAISLRAVVCLQQAHSFATKKWSKQPLELKHSCYDT